MNYTIFDTMNFLFNNHHDFLSRLIQSTPVIRVPVNAYGVWFIKSESYHTNQNLIWYHTRSWNHLKNKTCRCILAEVSWWRSNLEVQGPFSEMMTAVGHSRTGCKNLDKWRLITKLMLGIVARAIHRQSIEHHFEACS